MAQSLANVLLHIVFSTKDRQPLILPHVEARLHQYIATVCKDLDSPVIFSGGMQDHIHVLLSLSREVTISNLISNMKSQSSRWIKKIDKDTKSFAWQRGYGAFSIGESGRSATIKYIANQQKHHKKFTFQDEFTKLLKKYQMVFDEKYLWD